MENCVSCQGSANHKVTLGPGPPKGTASPAHSFSASTRNSVRA